jgi:hypothetical protein
MNVSYFDAKVLDSDMAGRPTSGQSQVRLLLLLIVGLRYPTHSPTTSTHSWNQDLFFVITLSYWQERSRMFHFDVLAVHCLLSRAGPPW